MRKSSIMPWFVVLSFGLILAGLGYAGEWLIAPSVLLGTAILLVGCLVDELAAVMRRNRYPQRRRRPPYYY